MNEKTGKQTKTQGDDRIDYTAKPLMSKIGENLKQMYDEVLSEPIPDEFLKLLEQANTKSSAKTDGCNSSFHSDTE